MRKINLRGINAETVTGVLVLVLALVNAILRIFNVNTIPIVEEEIGDIVSMAFLVITALYNTWKNRNITPASQIAQEITDALKNGEILVEDVQEVISKIRN